MNQLWPHKSTQDRARCNQVRTHVEQGIYIPKLRMGQSKPARDRSNDRKIDASIRFWVCDLRLVTNSLIITLNEASPSPPPRATPIHSSTRNSWVPMCQNRRGNGAGRGRGIRILTGRDGTERDGTGRDGMGPKCTPVPSFTGPSREKCCVVIDVIGWPPRSRRERDGTGPASSGAGFLTLLLSTRCSSCPHHCSCAREESFSS